MNERHIQAISRELNIKQQQVQATAQLLDEGGTVPFIARYRKEATGSLDETLITAIRDRLAQMDALDKRKEAVLKSLEDQEKLTDELKEKILGADTPALLEDIYLPFRPKRRTRAAIAREKGLEPLAALLFDQVPSTDPAREAMRFLDPGKGVSSFEEALAGARDIISEWINENAATRAQLRSLFLDKGTIRSKVAAGKEDEAIQFRDYFDKEEPIGGAPSHRILAMLRGEKEGFLTVRLGPPEEDAVACLHASFIKNDSPASREIAGALRDSYKRLLSPSLETEAKKAAKERADREAIHIFADNLRHLLMAPPLGFKKLLALDPGFRTGCKLVCLDPQGKLVHNETIYPHSGQHASAKSAERVRALVTEYGIEAIAIGNGTAGRETESFIRELGLPDTVQVIMVDESGASIYSASNLAREELPNFDVTVRGAVSIGRRLMDPLAELVKIDPKSIGVGQYQHDVDQAELKKSLDDVVMSCVNAVGVEINSASAQLLSYVSGLGVQLARNIITYRETNGPFRSRTALRKVPRLGPRAFEQAAGFLRISGAENPLDASAVHPESYHIVEKMARDLGCSITDIIHDASIRKTIGPKAYVTAQAGLPTLMDILSELDKPGRDPRETFESFAFAPGVERPSDLEVGMRLPGIVTNVTAFGAFVDVGVHRDGLVHVSEMSDNFVKDPRQVVRVHEHVSVTVLEVDLDRGRISLSMKSSAVGGKKIPVERSPGKTDEKKGRTAKKTAFNNPFEEALKRR